MLCSMTSLTGYESPQLHGRRLRLFQHLHKIQVDLIVTPTKVGCLLWSWFALYNETNQEAHE